MSSEKEKDPSRIILCTHNLRDPGDPLKCGWTGPASTYLAHLKLRHDGKDFKRPETGL